MNVPNRFMNDEEMDSTNGVSYTRRDQNRQQQMRHHAFERRGARPNSCNGLHRRRNKRFAW